MARPSSPHFIGASGFRWMAPLKRTPLAKPPTSNARAPLLPTLAALCILAAGAATVGGQRLAASPPVGTAPAGEAALPAAPAAADAPRFDLSQPGLRVETPASSPANHSPSLAALSDGGLAMAWFGGSREGARDVQIFLARFEGQRWSAPQVVLSTDQLIRSSGRFISKLGNPVLMARGEQLHLWFVMVSAGGWGGARLGHMRSPDGGRTWSAPRLLVTSPFMNVSTLVRSTGWWIDPVSARPVGGPVTGRVAGPVAGGELFLPAYFELSLKYPLLLRLDDQGQLLDRYPFGALTGLLQPSVVSGPGDTLTAYFRRSLALPQARVHAATSVDGGAHWGAAEPIDVPNGDASVVAWADGPVHWLAANPEPGNRQAMAIYRLSARGPAASPAGKDDQPTLRTPVQVLDLQRPLPDPARPGSFLHSEFSYPSVAQTRDGRLHLVYTADGRRAIRHWIWSPQAPGQAASPRAAGGPS